ncbi:unnamed protein product [Closterium sp. Naga37s-1]|nr:unnamed protein product [Closterium sp. Naga37s-1]
MCFTSREYTVAFPSAGVPAPNTFRIHPYVKQYHTKATNTSCCVCASLRVALYNNNLTGPLPASLTNLDRLSILQMDFNRITSPIPELAPTMEHLNLQYNRLTGTMPDWLSKLKGLQPILLRLELQILIRLESCMTPPIETLTHSSLSSSAPIVVSLLRPRPVTSLFPCSLLLCPCSTLQGNQLSGTIPATLGGLDALKDFQVPENLACPDNSTWCVVPQTNTTAFCSHCSGFCATCSLEAPPSPPVDRCAGVVCSGNFMVCNADTGTCSRELPAWLVAIIIILSALLAFALLCLAAVWLYKRCFSSSSDSSSGYHSMYPTQRWSFGKSSRVGAGAWADSAGLCREYPLKLMSSKHHPHLVRLLGFAMGGNVRSQIEQVLIYELMPHGDLHKWMGRDAVAPLTLQQRLDILIGAARGLAYLHSFGIVHRDIKPANILLDAHMQAKVSDFGLVKLGEGEQSVQSTRVLGTPGYVDPTYASTKKATTAADVYSFGILMLAVMSGREATFMEAKEQQHILSWGYRPDISVEGAEGVEAMIVCVGIVGQANNPLYLQSFLEADDPLKFHFIVHCSLDVIDERVSTPRRGGANEPYLGLLYPTEDFRVYGYVSNTQIKFIIVVDGLDLRESDIRNFFKRLHSAYVDATSNPFHVPGKRISSPAFAERVGALVHSVSPPKAT